MPQTQTKHVEWTQANIDKCQCMNCPVESGSSCAADKMKAMSGMSQGPGAMAGTPSPQDVPKVYCSQGTAGCGDLDFSQNCICPSCDVWRENDLSNYKYCRNGSAEVQG